MFFDTSHNSRRGVLANIYAAFAETATKMWAYARCMTRRPGTAIVIGTCAATTALSNKGRGREEKSRLTLLFT
ncbi:hypothetical protein MYCTH_2294977 [Thermothelomyces thermophilus ATCC 42464]|uniref:Uncharacterized protein n=1 Tax=Thermothelomyces thermophilus (strain ATCC 42464 / BCRC 31852 / DSM 1799) TaxID=573729 RepID=G2Q361_THET4|nr:uncharacterized protein MYCTH_2294977 [Thermothelomyces thermophilus ATCC 42464]AEO53524.1 hypothetical protein MYCTH_2294977 [Thermothelomyces thermophilus ATCC 42464]